MLMRPAKNDRPTLGPDGVRIAGRATPLTMIALGAGAYLLLGVLVDISVVRSPDGNRYLHTLLLTLLALAFVLAAEGLLALIRAIPAADMLGWPFRASVVGAVAYSIAWGHRVFVNCWYFDDWGYLVTRPFDKALITSPLNDHFLPLLKIVIWGMTRAFGFDYIGAACLQQAAFLVVIVGLAHLLWNATRRSWLLILLVGLFALWPTYGVARTWFGGGFLLTASAGLLTVYVLHALRMISGENLRLMDVCVSGVLAAAAVFISSQTLVPAVYLIAFFLPALVVSQHRTADVRRLAIFCLVSLIPTAVAFWGRSAYVVHPPLNPSGLFDGRLFTNLGIFILNKGLLADSFGGWLPTVTVAGLFALPLAFAAKRLATTRVIDTDRWAGLAGIILGGCSALVIPLVQIGLGRRWSYDAAINPYYTTMPFLGLCLTWSGIGIALARHPGNGASTQPTRSVALAVAAAIAAAGISAKIIRDETPLKVDLKLIYSQRHFIDDLGAAVCDLALLHRDGPPVRWVPSFDIVNCRLCANIIGPPQFLHDLGFDSIASIAARRTCPKTNLRVLTQGAAVTDGRESKAAMSFVQKYLLPLDLTAVPPEIAAASVQIRGKSAIDALNGADGLPENGTRSFSVPTGTITTCDGWAFDDVTKSVPEHIWIELTNTETRKRYYWPAHRYSRPTFSQGLKMPSIEYCGFHCEAVRYALPIGVYQMKIYQVEGNTALVSDFSTWSISPTVIVK